MGQSPESSSSEKSRSGGSKSSGHGGRSDESSKSGGKNSGASSDSASKQSGGGLEAGGTPQEQAEKLLGIAREQATTQVASQKERVAESLGALGSALHEASRQMREQDQGQVSGYVDMAAGQVDHLASMLREQDIAQLIDTTGRFARREPTLFLAAAFALGFAGTRFLRSSAPAQNSQRWDTGSSGYESSFEGSDRYGSVAYGAGAGSGGNSGRGTSGTKNSSGFGSSDTGSGFDANRSKGIDDRSGVGAGSGSVSGDNWGAQANAGSGAEG